MADADRTDEVTSRGRDVAESRFRRWSAIVVVVLLALLLVWVGRGTVETPLPHTLVVYAFSTLEEAMEGGVFPAFQARWREESGEWVEFVATFSGSGTITGRIIERLPAQVAVLSSELDALRLMESGVVRRATWRELPQGGVLTRTPMVIVTRPGNPLGITAFADLARPGIEVVHADPTTSGAGQWGLLAAWGEALGGGDATAAAALLRGTWANVRTRPASAQAARVVFESGVGDVLVTYEQDAVGHPPRPPVEGEVVVPRRTIFAESTVVRLDRNVAPGEEERVRAFVDFLWSREAQEVFVAHGFRSPVFPELAPDRGFVEVPEPFTLEDLGGAREAKREVVEAVWRDQVSRPTGTVP